MRIWRLLFLNLDIRCVRLSIVGDCLGSKLAQDEQQFGNFTDSRLMESCWWETQTIDERSETVEITTIRAVEIAVNIRPSTAAIWVERLRQINLTQVVDIFSRIPDDLIMLNETSFSIELLEYNRQQIFKLKFDNPIVRA